MNKELTQTIASEVQLFQSVEQKENFLFLQRRETKRYSGAFFRFMARKRHLKKEIEEAIQYAEKCGWRVVKAGNSAHAWGRLLCQEESREGCQISIWSTPRNTENHARQIRRAVERCPHQGDRDDKL